MNELQNYYIEQAGSGLAGFRGVRYQRGRGFFGRLLSGAVFPLLRFLGKNVLKTGTNVASDLLQSDDFSIENIKDIAKNRAKEGAVEAFKDGFRRMRGKGKRRKRITKRCVKRKSIKRRQRRLKTKRSSKSNLLF